MHFTQFLLIATGLLGSAALANPLPDPNAQPSPVELVARATYTIACTGGLHPDSHCLPPHSRCDSYGTYHPESGYKTQCAKCGCQRMN